MGGKIDIRIVRVIALWADAIREAARLATDDSAVSIYLSTPLPEDEPVEGVDVAMGPCALTVGDELVRCDFDKADFMPSRHDVGNLLGLALTPYIEGVGRVVFDDGLEGFVLRRVLDVGKVTEGHGVPLSIYCPQLPGAESKDAPSIAEISITDEMIEAGAAALALFNCTDDGEAAALAAFEAMTRAIDRCPETSRPYISRGPTGY